MDYSSAVNQIQVPVLAAHTNADRYLAAFQQRMAQALARHAAAVVNTRHPDKETERVLRRRQVKADRRWRYTAYHNATKEVNRLTIDFLEAVSTAERGDGAVAPPLQ